MSDPTAFVDGLLHEPTQVHDGGVDLTAAEVYDLAGPGRIDFGGDELEPAEREPHERTWRNPDDDYQWWHLDGGTYLLEYNESLSGERPVRIEPRTALIERGASHPTITTRELPLMALSVPPGGLRLKENARVTTVVSTG